MKEKRTVGSPFFRAFPSYLISRETTGVSVHIFIHTSISNKLYQPISGTFWNIYTYSACFLSLCTTASSGDTLHRSSVAGAVVEHHAPYWEQPFSQPYFDNSTRRDMTTTVGQSAYLHCRVRNLGDRAVSWIRKRDLHILTVGILTYTNDQRFQSLHSDGSDEWTLKVSSPQVRDSGTYECQVSTEPKISQAFRLNVVGKLLNCFYLTLSACIPTIHPFSRFFSVSSFPLHVTVPLPLFFCVMVLSVLQETDMLKYCTIIFTNHSSYRKNAWSEVLTTLTTNITNCIPFWLV